MRFLFLLFIVMPIVEITLLIQVGQVIGTWNTVGLVLLSAFIGVNMLRYQSLATLSRAQQRAQAGEIPGQEMVEGIALAVGGALLVTPGFVTDLIGFSCLLPQSRKWLAAQLMKRFTVVAMSSSTQYSHGAPHGHSKSPHSRPNGHQGDVIEGEYERKD